MRNKEKTVFLVIVVLLLAAVLILGAGARDKVKNGHGFLFIPSFTPTATNTAVPSDTPTVTPSMTMTMTVTASFTPTLTATMTATDTVTPSAAPTDTPVPSETPTPLPTFDETAWTEKFFAGLTAEAEAFELAQTPSPTPVIPDEDLYTGLRKVNPADGKELFFVETDHEEGIRGFWMDWNEVSNEEYAACVRAGYCSAPYSEFREGNEYYSGEGFRDHPVVNVTRGQAMAYCSWAGMRLMSSADWQDAAASVPVDESNTDRRTDGPAANDPEHSNIIGNVWEWTMDEDYAGQVIIAGGSWNTARQDIREGRFGRTVPNSYAEDIGFRCISYVTAK